MQFDVLDSRDKASQPSVQHIIMPPSCTTLQALWPPVSRLWSHLTPVVHRLGDLTHLQQLDLSDNFINGTLPPELFKLTQLELLSLDGCYVNGTIPPQLGDMTSLTVRTRCGGWCGVRPVLARPRSRRPGAHSEAWRV